MNLEVIVLGMFEANCVILWDEFDRAIIIDPGANAHSIRSFLHQQHLQPAAYLLTHGHIDHIGALADMYDAYPCPMYMHPADASWAFSPANQMIPYYSAPRKPSEPVTPVSHEQRIVSGNTEIRVVHTPGHSPGSVCYHFERDNLLISGDTLFKGSVGRTDLSGGNPRELGRSLRLLTGLSDSVRVIPGHGPETTIRREKDTNYFLRNELI